MIIRVIGSGCATCKNLYELTKKAVHELELSYTVEYCTDVTALLQLGIMTSPAIAIDDKPILIGSTTSIDKVKEVLKQGLLQHPRKEEPPTTCSCK